MITCQSCGIKLKTFSITRKWCFECRKKRQLEYNKIVRRKKGVEHGN